VKRVAQDDGFVGVKQRWLGGLKHKYRKGHWLSG
jgi:hypothetical protein